MNGRAVTRAVAAPAATALLGMLALGTALLAGAAFAITPAPALPVWAFDFAPGSTGPKRGHEAFVALAFDIAGLLDRNREPDARPAWLTIVGYAPGDAVLAARRAVAVRGALLRAGVAPERVVLLEPNSGLPLIARSVEPDLARSLESNPRPALLAALLALPDKVEVALCPTVGRLERRRCAPP